MFWISRNHGMGWDKLAGTGVATAQKFIQWKKVVKVFSKNLHRNFIKRGGNSEKMVPGAFP